MPETLTNFLTILLTSEGDLAQRTTVEVLSRFIMSGLAEADRWYTSRAPSGDSLRDMIVVLGPEGRSRVFLGDHPDLLPGELTALEQAWAMAASEASVTGPIVVGLKCALGVVPPPHARPQPWIAPSSTWIAATRAFGDDCSLDDAARRLLVEGQATQ